MRKALIATAIAALFLSGCSGLSLSWSASYAYPGQKAEK